MVTALAAAPAMAATFKWTSASDIPTWDVHSQNNALGNGVHAAVYESLFYYNRKFELEPMLATGYKQAQPDAAAHHAAAGRQVPRRRAFTADDVVFSIERAMAKTSNFGVYIAGHRTKSCKVDDLTVDIITKGPNPVLLRAADRAAHHEQGLGREEQRRRAAGLSRPRKRPSPRATPTAPARSC